MRHFHVLFKIRPVISASPAFLFVFTFLLSINIMAKPVTMTIPSQPGIEKAETRPAATTKEKKPENEQSAQIPEVDILISLIEPFENAGVDMDMPQLFFSLLHASGEQDERPQPVNLLGDVEEIRYLDKKAWGANVALEKPGLYHFILEGKPWWNEDRNMFMQQQSRVMLPVLGSGGGWEISTGQSFEIQPLTRPFGLAAPAIFSGRVLVDGKPAGNIAVSMARINTDKTMAPTEWHKRQAARTDAEGQFSFILNQPGWWFCEAVMPGSPLKGPDGQPHELEKGTVLWLYVDPPASKAKR